MLTEVTRYRMLGGEFSEGLTPVKPKKYQLTIHDGYVSLSGPKFGGVEYGKASAISTPYVGATYHFRVDVMVQVGDPLAGSYRLERWFVRLLEVPA